MPAAVLATFQTEDAQTMAVDIRNMDGKIRPTISGPLAHYIRDLLNTGLYGDRETEVVRTLVREGIQKAATSKLIQLRKFDEAGRPL